MRKTAVDIFRDYCRNRGLRVTAGREIIIDEIFKETGHFNVESLFARIRENNPETKLARGSIYRTLPFLIDAGLIRESLPNKKGICYEKTLGCAHHDHLKCMNCGRVFEFYSRQIDAAQKEICRKYGFEMHWHMHLIGGYCRTCRK